jgi:hypothetical protein
MWHPGHPYIDISAIQSRQDINDVDAHLEHVSVGVPSFEGRDRLSEVLDHVGTGRMTDSEHTFDLSRCTTHAVYRIDQRLVSWSDSVQHLLTQPGQVDTSTRPPKEDATDLPLQRLY